MSVVYLPVEPQNGLTSSDRADALDKEVWRLVRPASVQSSDDTKFLYARMVHPTTGQVALLGETTDELPVHPDVDLTTLLALLPEVSQQEKDMLTFYIDANLGKTVLFGNLIPSSSTQLTIQEADAAGWIPNDDIV